MMKRSPLKELGNLSNSAHFKHQMNPAKCLSKTVEFSDVPMEPAPSKVTSQLDILSVGYRKGDAKDTHCVGTNTTTIPAAPKTPLKISGQASKPGTPPLTPLANLKVLIQAASTAHALEEEDKPQVTLEMVSERREAPRKDAPVSEEGKVSGTKEGGEEGGGRKMKSLAILCKRFLSIAESEIGVGTDFSLETMSKKLGTNRRRIYDIINVLEALEMIVKQSKNWYTWLGQDNLLVTLAKMRAMAEDDADFRNLLNKENGLDSSQAAKDNPTPPPTTTRSEVQLEASYKMEDPPGAEESSSAGGGRWDKSLGVLCQKFIMLFLVTPENEVTLDFAGNILMPDDGSFSLQPTNPKTKVRRLYDIANVLTTLGLIRKKTFLAPNHRKMPGYSWAGPTLDQIQTIPVFRKSEFNLYPFYSKRKGGNGGGAGGTSLTRKPSFGSVRPFLHQYEVKNHPRAASSQPSSAPSSPIKSKDSGFKRSLSFGAGARARHNAQPSPVPLQQMLAKNREEPVPSTRSPPTTSSQATASNGKCVLARQLTYRQIDYLQEVKEFEAEIQKHSHKFPHVAPVFHEFVLKFQNTLEQAAASGRSILPKAESMPTPNTSPASLVSPQELANTFLTSPQPNPLPLAVSCPPNDSPTSAAAAGMVSPPSAGIATPSESTTTPTTPVTHGTLSPQSKLKKFASVESMLINTNHAHLLNSMRQNQTGPIFPYAVDGGNSFNPNSLLATTSAAYPFFPGGSPNSAFLPLSCYSFPLSPATSAANGVKTTQASSLALKPVFSEQCRPVLEDSSSKRVKLDMS